jgi:hypothetical protein
LCGFGFIESEPLAGGCGQDQPVNRLTDVMPDEPLERDFIQTAVLERRDERKPESLESLCILFQLSFS